MVEVLTTAYVSEAVPIDKCNSIMEQPSVLMGFAPLSAKSCFSLERHMLLERYGLQPPHCCMSTSNFRS